MSVLKSKKLLLQLSLVLLALPLLTFKSSILQISCPAGWLRTAKVLSGAMDVFAWFSFSWLATTVVEIFIWNAWERQSGRPIPKLLKDIVNAAIYFVFFLLVLSFVFNAPVTGLIAGSSVMAAVVGLAVTRMISDVFSGVALSLERAYSIGDWLEIEMKTRPLGYITGKVVEINWRATRLHTKADETLIIPNSEIARMRFINFSIPQRHYRTDVQVSLSHTIPPDRVKRILAAAVKSTPGIMKDPAPKITLMRFTDRGVLWCARFWIDDFSNHRKVVKVAHETILRHLQVAGIDLSYHRVNQQFVRSDELEKKPVKERLVKRVELFDVLEDQHLSMLAEAMQERTYGAKEKIVIQDEEGSSLFIVAEGVVSILKRDEEGNSQWMAHIEPGQYFGEMSLLTGQVRTATAQADTEVVCYEITKDILKPIFEEEPGLLQKISLMMSERQFRLSKVQTKEVQQLVSAEKEKTADRLLKQIQDFFGVIIR